MTPTRLAKIRAVLDRRQPDLTLITDHVHKGRNLSAIVRTCDAVGISQLHCVMADDEYRAFRGTAKGSHQWVDVKRAHSMREAVECLKPQGFQFVAADVCPQSVDFRELDYCRPTAFILGAEKWGLSVEARQVVDHFITIPMVGMVESYNVSVASAIILSEAQRQREQQGFYANRRLPDSIYQDLLFEWCQPIVAAYCQRQNLPYPDLGEDGEILEASKWYQSVKHLESRTQQLGS